MKTLLLFAMAAALHAVTIADTLYLPDGSIAAGHLSISLVTGTFSSSTTFAAFRKDVWLVSGAISVDLAANSTLSPAGTLYRVEYYLTNGTTQTEYWSVPTGGPYTIRDVRWIPTAQDYSANQSGTAWTVGLAAHGINHRNILFACYDSSGNEVECAKNVHPTNFTITARFATSQTGRIFASGSLNGYARNPAKAFTSATSVTFANSEHNLNTGRIIGACYDDTGEDFECQISVHPTTFAVTATWITSKTGLLVVGGR